MALFALSLLIGGLIGALVGAYPPIRETIAAWRPANPRRLLIVTGIVLLAGIIGYVIFWLHYFDVAAPSNKFRVFVLIKRALQFAPLMAAGAAVGYEAIRWLRRLSLPGQRYIVPHGIGIGAAGLLVLALFMLQDPRMLGAIRSVNTPVLSLEFKLAESARPLSAPQPGTSFASADDPDPIMQTLRTLHSLPTSIRRDIEYAQALSAGQLDATTRDWIDREQRFYEDKLKPFVECLGNIRRRVQDTDALIFIDRDTGRVLRRAHRILLSGQADSRRNFIRAMEDFVKDKLPPILKNLKERHEEYKAIKPVFVEPNRVSKLEVCENVLANPDAFGTAINFHVNQGGFRQEMPYFSLVVAGLLNILNEKLAAAEEIDAWLKHRREQPPTPPAKAWDATTQLQRLMQMRAHYVAAQWLSTEPRHAAMVVRRLRRAIDLIDESFTHAKMKEAENGITLTALFQNMNRKSGKTTEPSSLCRQLPAPLVGLTFATLSMVNTAMYMVVHYDLISLEVDPAEFVRDHHDILGFADPDCFNKSEYSQDTRQFGFAAFTNSYLTTKFTLLRLLPEDRVRAEMCDIAKTVDNAQKHLTRLMHHGQNDLDQHDDKSAEEKFALARALKRQILTFNEVVLRLGPRAC